jgi:hypothetical protein
MLAIRYDVPVFEAKKEIAAKIVAAWVAAAKPILQRPFVPQSELKPRPRGKQIPRLRSG